MRSEYSLLPYILFSPYSPLKLAAERANFSSNQKVSKPDLFPYCEAFEDLIHETVHGNAAPSPLFPLHSSPYNPFTLRTNPSVGMEWIQGLHQGGILQQKEHRSVRDIVSWPHPSTNLGPRLENARKLLGEAGMSADSEQDMYEFFQSAPARPLPAHFSEVEKFLLKQLERLDSPEGKQALRELTDSRALRELMDSRMVKDMFAMVSAAIAETPPSKPKHRTTTEADVERTSKAMPSDATSGEIKHATSSQDMNKVVSTSTTSERHVDEDGSVETTVTVWKRFADGRESTTTTTHFEDSGAWKESEEERKEVKAEKQPEQKKGWFWN